MSVILPIILLFIGTVNVKAQVCPVPEGIDCPDPSWNTMSAMIITVNIPSTPYICSLRVAYSTRVDCPDRPCEVRIDAVEFISCTGGYVISLDMFVFDNIAFEIVKSGVICPLPADGLCKSDFYVNNSPCYAVVSDPRFQYPVALPCYADCCTRVVQICNNGGVMVTTIISRSNNVCPPGTSIGNPGVNCTNVCGY